MSSTLGKALCLAVLALLTLNACAFPGLSRSGIPRYTPPDPPPVPRAKPAGLGSAPVRATGRSAPVVAVDRAPVAAAAPDRSSAPGATQVAFQTDARLPVYRVRRGDTVYGISRRFRVPVRDVIDFNALPPPYSLRVGQRLRIPVPRRHKVARGETVYGIARRYEVPIRSVIDANGLAPPYRLKVGQAVLIPVQRIHVVARGETVYGISRRYGVEMSELVRVNRIPPPYTITPAQKLALPSSRPKSAEPTAARRALAAAAPLPAKSVAVPKPPPRGASKFLWPVTGRVILGFGPKKDGLHNDGINIGAPRGTPVRAADNGVVAYAGNELRGFGNLLLVKHAGGWVTAYAHTERVLVRRGDTVRRGQTIGRVGSTGNVARPQLHFEVRKGTRAIDPVRVLGPQTARN